MEVVLIRHSKPDYSFITKNMNCQWANLAPLSKKGIEIANSIKDDPRLKEGKVLSSPYTRALQTTQILFGNREITVEPLLHEWLPDKNFDITAYNVYIKNKEYKECNGINKHNLYTWEDKYEMKKRIEKIINKYKEMGEEKIIIVAHGRLINSFLDKTDRIDYCAINVINL